MGLGMKPNRFWIEILVLSAAAACALALFIATVAVATDAVTSGELRQASEAAGESARSSSSASPPAPQHFYEGMVTCSRCGAKHSAAMSRTATDCARVCVHNGSSFALIDGDKAYQLDGDLIALKKLAGQRVRVMGVARGNTIHVSSVAPAS